MLPSNPWSNNMSNYVIVTPKEFKLGGRASDELSHSTWVRTLDWLTQWTVGGNIKGAIAPTKDAALALQMEHIRATLIPSWLSALGVKPEHFDVRLSIDEAKGGLFYAPEGSHSQWHAVK